MSRVGFIVGRDREDAIRSAEQAYKWQRIAIFRFATAEKVDVRVVDSVGEFRSLGPLTPIYRAAGFEKRPDVDKWTALVEARVAIWGPPPVAQPLLQARADRTISREGYETAND